MLSRVADSIFWMSRYIERAENVARFIDVNWHLILDSHARETEQWQALVNITGDHAAFNERYGKATDENVIRFLTFESANPNSILSCVRSARENARGIREVISSEMFEQINSFYLMMNDSASGNKALESPYDFFNQVKMASHLFVGITDTTMSHGEGWNFCRMGRMLERTDKTSRILDVKYYMLRPQTEKEASDDIEDIQWAAVLKSASGLEMYRKRHRRILPSRVVEFLMLDREFPRAMLCCLRTTDEALHEISGNPAGTYKCAAEQRLGLLCSELGFASVDQIIASGLHEYVDALQTKLNVIGESIDDAFFSMKKRPPQTLPGTTQIQVQS